MTDQTLLQQYVQTGSQQAFADLVSRHADWVYSAAVRMVRDPGLAEDVTQAVFVLLSQKAPKVGSKPINAWLFAVLRFAASHALRAKARRQRHEARAAAMKPIANSDDERIWEEVAPLLEDAVRQLGSRDRQAILLRFYQRKSMAEIGEAMGISEDAAKKQMARAIQKLRSGLGRQGKATLPSALEVVLFAKTTSAAPTDLVSKCYSVSSANADVLAIAKGSSLMMYKSNLKIAAMLTGLGLTCGAVALAIFDIHPSQPTRPTLLATTAPTTNPSNIVPNLKLILAWNRQAFDVPPPVLIPDAMRQTDAYKRWVQIGDAEKLEWVDPVDRSRYVADAIGNVILDGKRLQLIASVSKYRSDGTLAEKTNMAQSSEDFGMPEEWHVYAADGVTKLFYVTNRTNGLPGTPFIEYVDIRHPDGTATQYRANRYGVIVVEWLLNANWTTTVGYLNGAQKYENLTPNDLK
jgi:RNA polymerase sigma factor (sigma-70 family)